MGKKREIQDGGGQPSKKQKIQDGGRHIQIEASFLNMLEDEVHINKLPEDILVWILCKLSVEEAARTSVVSRRWNTLWKKAIVVAPRLKLYSFRVKGTTRLRCHTSNNQMHKYVNRVNQVLKLHKPPTLDEFIIGYPLDSTYTQDINKWVEFAAKKEVKKLVLDFCARIEGLDKVPSYGGFLASFGGIMFYKLTDLYLRGINVTDNVIHSLLSNSPLIERLCVIDSQGLHNLEVTASNLRYFKIRSCNDLKYLKIYAPNLNVMKLYTAAAFPRSPRHIYVNSYAPNLSRLTFVLTRKFSRSVPLSVSDCFHELLVQFSQVKKRLSIKMYPEAFLAITKHNVIPHPELSYVEHLKITINFPWPLWYIAAKSSRYHGLLWPSFLLKAAPSLHKLSIKFFHKEHKLTCGDIDNMWVVEDIPKEVKENVGNYSHQNLKVVELIGFTGIRYEIKLVLLLVEIAASLEKLVIRVCIPNIWWPDKDTLSYKINQYDGFCRNSVKMLKTQIRSEIDLVII